MKRFLALFLATVMLLLALVSCNAVAPKPTATPSENPTSTDKKPSSESPTEQPTSPDGTPPANNEQTVDKEPEYIGMTVSNSAPTTAQALSHRDYIALGEGNNGKNFEDAIKEKFPNPTPVKDQYFSKKNSDIYIMIHIENPNAYEIQSFTLNGNKYSSYMFEYGSTMELLILKYNVGDVEEVQEYTLDAIKYLDGTKIKDVKLKGDRTVTVNITPEQQPTVTVNNFTANTQGFTASIVVTDEKGLISASGGSVYLLIYDGESLVYNGELTEATVNIDSLKSYANYQFAVVVVYDALDGNGKAAYIMAQKGFSTFNFTLPDSSTDFSDINFEGKRINILVRNDENVTAGWTPESGTSVTLYKNIIERNELIEKMFNLDVNFIYVNGGNVVSDYFDMFTAYVQADVDNMLHEIDIAAYPSSFVISSANLRDYNANLLDKDTFPYFDFSLPCWNQSVVKNGTVNGQLYGCTGDMAMSLFDNAEVIWHNQTLYDKIKKDSDPSDMQTLALSGDWYYSELYKWANWAEAEKGYCSDNYGISLVGGSYSSVADVIPLAWNLNFVNERSNGTHAYNFVGNQRAELAMKDLKALYNASGNFYRISREPGNQCVCNSHFVNGNILFSSDQIAFSKASVLARRNMEDTCVILPWPKYDTSQDNYATTSLDRFDMLSVLDHSYGIIPINGAEVSVYLQFGMGHSYANQREQYVKDKILPSSIGAEYDESLLLRSKALFNIIANGIGFDFTMIHSGSLGSSYSIWRHAYIGTDTIENNYQKNINQYDSALKELDIWFGLTSP